MNNAHSFGDKTGPVPIAFYFMDNLYQDFCSRYLKGPDLLRYHFALLKLVGKVKTSLRDASRLFLDYKVP
jgi:hypothetical protein